MSAPSRRRAKKRIVTFTLVIEAQEMIVTYQPDWAPDLGHFEFRSPHEPPRRIPVSETGYRSHFASAEEIEGFGSPQDYARDVVRSLLRPRSTRSRQDHNQMRLF